ncbi:MAG: right-handed parallel beta-helix repeat-containing protein [Pseudomonadota bacterium]|nr:right-handed parallel beta-helix repeat-containing protein [Pseudomonadota bacterium]
MSAIKLFVLIIVITIAGCAVKTDSGIMAGPALKTESASATVKKKHNLPSTIAVLPFSNQTKSEFAISVIRKTLVNHFSSKNYRILHSAEVDNRLALAGLDSPEKIESAPADQIREILGVDGLIYGSVTHYEKHFAGVGARISVGVELEFLNQSDEIIWAAEDVRKSYAGGLSTSPVGLILNALAAAKHLYGDINLFRAADDLGRALAEQMPAPEFLAGNTLPVITNVVHSGVGQYLRYGDVLEIGLEGDAGLTAVASIDGAGLIELSEVEAGQYVGRLNISNTLNLENVNLVGRLKNDTGQFSSWTSPYGLVNIDNQPPLAVNQLTVHSADRQVKLNWATDEPDVVEYLISITDPATSEQSQVRVPLNSYSMTEIENFKAYPISIQAVDAAGNTGAMTTTSGMAAPDPRFSSAQDLNSVVPNIIHGTYRMQSQNNPYLLNSQTTIATDGILMIGPGVDIKVSPSARISVLGEIHSFGNQEQPVRAVSSSGQNFQQFLILQSNQAISLDGLRVENANIPIQILAGNPTISGASLHGSFNAITISGSARPLIKDSLISGSSASGVIVSGQAQPSFQGNRFKQNEPFHLQNGSNYEIDLRGNQFSPEASIATVLGQFIYGEQ